VESLIQRRLLKATALCALALPFSAVAEPTIPAPVFPLFGQTIEDSGDAKWSWTGSTSPDGLSLEYDVELFGPTTLFAVASGVVADNGTDDVLEWLVDDPTLLPGVYEWRVRARDDEGGESEWTEKVQFGFLLTNAPPSTPAFLSPTSEGAVETTQPLFVVQPSVDFFPETDLDLELPVVHTLLVDSSETFVSDDLVTLDMPIVDSEESDEVVAMVDLEGTMTFLNEDTDYFARVTATDVDGAVVSSETITFTVRGENSAPATPDLVRPLPNEVTTANPTLRSTTVTDPEGDVVTYQFAVGSTKDLSGVAVVSSPTREFDVTQDLTGGFYWTVRAVDERDAASEWATPQYAVAADPAWGCTMADGGPANWTWLSLGLGLGLMRRRRSSRRRSAHALKSSK